MEQTWVVQVAQGPQAPYWTAFYPSGICSQAAPPVPSSTGSSKGRETSSENASKKRSRASTQPFVAQKPLLANPPGVVPSVERLTPRST
eukprot:scaffold2409_cov173-Cylindrotheca_fusiformis.AAC.1